jgi:hypothetical protein
VELAKNKFSSYLPIGQTWATLSGYTNVLLLFRRSLSCISYHCTYPFLMSSEDPNAWRRRWKTPEFKRTSQSARLLVYGFLFCVLLAIVLKLLDYFIK